MPSILLKFSHFLNSSTLEWYIWPSIHIGDHFPRTLREKKKHLLNGM